jgi:hypothetical protein
VLPQLKYPYLSFFTLGADGRMHEVERSIFPIADSWGEHRWEFVLLRKGKTILVRAAKTKRTLHKFTWNGEKFVDQK